MRIILFFDLPSVTSKDQRNYRKFVKNIKKLGFYMIQESVYVKLSIDIQNANSTIDKIKSFLPPIGNIMTINITEKQFSNLEILIGDNPTEVLNTDERTIIL